MSVGSWIEEAGDYATVISRDLSCSFDGCPFRARWDVSMKRDGVLGDYSPVCTRHAKLLARIAAERRHAAEGGV